MPDQIHASATDPTPTLLHVDFEPTFRGAENQMALLHQELMSEGWRSFILVRRSSEFQERVLEQSIPHVYSVDAKGLRLGEFDLPLALAVVRVIRQVNPTIVHAHSAHAAGIALLARQLSRIPFRIVASRTVTDPIGFFSRWKYNAIDRVAAVCETIRQGLIRQGIQDQKVRTILIGLPLKLKGCEPCCQDEDSSNFQSEISWPVDDNPAAPSLTIGTFCALDRTQKDVATLIRAHAILLRQIPDARLVIVGDGPDRPRLEKMARDLGVSGMVDFRGWWKGDVFDVMKLMNIFVLSSFKEGASNVLVAAMAAGLPCVATDVGGNGEVLAQTGVLVPAAQPEIMARALIDLAGDFQRRSDLGCRAKERSAFFNVRRYARDMMNCYEELLTAPKRGD